MKTSDLSLIGSYRLTLEAALNPYLSYKHDFTLLMQEYPNTEAPQFSRRFLEKMRVSLMGELKYRLPDIKDADNDTFTL